jgi:hypothetical protein
MSLEEMAAWIATLSPADRARFEKDVLAATGHKLWVPNVGHQAMAYDSPADELFAGGEPGGGKTDLIAGLATTGSHKTSLLLRREFPQLKAVVDAVARILGTRKGYNGTDHVWTLPDRSIEFGSVPHEDDREKYQGRPHSLLAFDEITHFSRSQFTYLKLWCRSADPNERCRVVATGNPPSAPEGLWVTTYWRPWLDKTAPDPAREGELRWAVPLNDDDEREIFFKTPEEAQEHIRRHLRNPIFFDRDTGQPLAPRSRTFVPLPLEENRDYVRSGYQSALAGASKADRDMAAGDFAKGIPDHPDQLIPTAHLLMAQERWAKDGWRAFEQSGMGFDPAGGGQDAAELAYHHRGWFGPLMTLRGAQNAEPTTAIAAILTHRRNGAPIAVDNGGGYAGAIRTRLDDNGIQAALFNGANASNAKTLDSRIPFANLRAEAYVRFMEALDPNQEGGSVIALPADAELIADLAAVRIKRRTLEVRGEYQLESKDEIRARIGRSPGKGDAVVMAWWAGVRAARRQISGSRPPLRVINTAEARKRGLGIYGRYR